MKIQKRVTGEKNFFILKLNDSKFLNKIIDEIRKKLQEKKK